MWRSLQVDDSISELTVIIVTRALLLVNQALVGVAQSYAQRANGNPSGARRLLEIALELLSRANPRQGPGRRILGRIERGHGAVLRQSQPAGAGDPAARARRGWCGIG